MPDDIIFGSEAPDEGLGEPSPFLSPAVCAMAAFALAATALLGQNIVSVAASVLFGPQWDSNGVTGYYVSMGAGTLAQGIVAVLLAVRSFRSPTPWEANLGRAAVLVAAVALIGGGAMVAGALLHDGSMS